MGTANIPAYVSLSYTCYAIVVRIPIVKACSAARRLQVEITNIYIPKILSINYKFCIFMKLHHFNLKISHFHFMSMKNSRCFGTK